MRYFKDGKQVGERVFWGMLQSIATQEQKRYLLEGRKVLIAQTLYWIEF